MRGGAALALLVLLFVPPAQAEQAPPRAPAKEAAEPLRSCAACTGSAVKSWRIRKGDPKRPPPSKSLTEKEKDHDESDLAE